MVQQLSLSAVKLLVTSGSSRRGSFNAQLARWVVGRAREAGAQAECLDLQTLELPIFDEDLESRGMPDGARHIRAAFARCHAFIVCAPEYNGFPTPLLINALDWATRPGAEGEWPSGPDAIRGKVAGLLSASPGALGGLRGLVSLRSFLQMNLQMLIVPEQYALGGASQAFDAAGELLGESNRAGVLRVLNSVLGTAAALQRSTDPA